MSYFHFEHLSVWEILGEGVWGGKLPACVLQALPGRRRSCRNVRKLPILPINYYNQKEDIILLLRISYAQLKQGPYKQWSLGRLKKARLYSQRAEQAVTLHWGPIDQTGASVEVLRLASYHLLAAGLS